MTKEQMIAVINSLNTGDSRALEKRGGAFKDLLKEIVNSIPQGGNEPLIVAGEVSSDNFTVTDGTSLQYILEEYKRGRLILLHSSDGDYQAVISYIYAEGGVHTKEWYLELE